MARDTGVAANVDCTPPDRSADPTDGTTPGPPPAHLPGEGVIVKELVSVGERLLALAASLVGDGAR